MFNMKHEAIRRKKTAKVSDSVTKKFILKSAASAVSSRSEKNILKKTAIKPINSIRDNKSNRKTGSNKTALAVKQKIKKAEIIAPAKPVKIKRAKADKLQNIKVKATSPAKNVKIVEKKRKPTKVRDAKKSETKATRVVSPSSAKSNSQKVEPIASAKRIKSLSNAKAAPVSKQKAKISVSSKIKSNILEKQPKSGKSKIKIDSVKKTTVNKGSKQNAVTGKAKTEAKTNKPSKSVKIIETQPQKFGKVVASVKGADKLNKRQTAKNIQTAASEKAKPRRRQIRQSASAETSKNKKIEFNKRKFQEIEPVVATKKPNALETAAIDFPVKQNQKRRKLKPISSAVFRGQKARYDFKVFPLDGVFEDVSAIYVISRRKIDRQKKGHHALVCIGQTDSVLGEIKRHKIKCIKKHNANVISILPEADVKKRIKIEEDLRSAHAIACSIG